MFRSKPPPRGYVSREKFVSILVLVDVSFEVKNDLSITSWDLFQCWFSWMFRSKTGPVSHGQEDRVSILVLVDVSFEVWPNWHRSRHHRVSILVLVDVSFEAYRDEDCRELTTVSILVLVDVSFE